MTETNLPNLGMNHEPQQLVKSTSSDNHCTDQLTQQKALAAVIARIRRPLDLETIFTTSAREVRWLLQADRVGVFRFYPELDWEGEFVSEDVLPPWDSVLTARVNDHCFGPQYAAYYQEGRVQAVADIYAAGLSPCHAEILAQFQVRANLVVPLRNGKYLWGLLCIHHCSAPRQWQPEEIEFALAIAEHLAVAIEHAELLQQTRYQLQQQKALAAVIASVRESLELESIFNTTVREMRLLLEADRLCVLRFRDQLDGAGEYLFEDVGEQWPTAKTVAVPSYCFGQEFMAKYRQGVVSATPDILTEGLSDTHLDLLARLQVRSHLVAPLVKGKDLWGLLCLHQCRSKRYWQEYEIEFVKQIAAHLGVALQQAEYLEQFQIQTREMAKVAEQERAAQMQKTVGAIADKIRKSLEIGDIFHTSTREIRELLAADRVAIYQFHPNWTGSFVAESFGEGWIPLVGNTPIIEDTFLQQTRGGRYVNHETLAIDDIYKAGHATCHIQLLEQFQAKAYVVVPIFQGEQLWGLLAAYQNSGPRHWEEDEVKMLAQIGAQLGVALLQAEYISQVQLQAGQLAKAAEREKAADRQKTLATTINKIRRSLDLVTIFRTTAVEVRELLQADRVVIYHFHPDWSGEFKFEAIAEGWNSLMQQQLEQPELRENISECSLKSLAAAAVPDTYLQETRGGRFTRGQRFRTCDDIYTAGFTQCYLRILEKLQARAYAISGIYQGDKLWGLLAVYQNSGPRQWQDEDVELLTQIADQLGVALQQAELLEQTRQQAAELAKTLKNLQQTQAQMIQSEKMASLGQLVAGVAHEINNPVNFIHGNIHHLSNYVMDLLEFVQLYRQFYPQPLPEMQEYAAEMDLDYIMADLPNTLASMKMGTERIRQLVLSLRTFSRLDEAEMKPVNLHDGLESTLLLLQHRFKGNPPDREITLVKEYGNLPSIQCHPAQLNQVFMNILTNAIDAVQNLENPTITITTELVAEIAVIKIADNGMGIPDPLLSRIFDPFFTTKEPGKGTGLGLSNSYQIVVETHRGQLRCFSQPNQGSTFVIEIPTARV
ncbi:GAF domain-containing protein [[Phormidium] sp. ETS-05]|uniref:GAF domain-containing sensor histidine kinase n=1 Tax=[Phormidium] sp. ETS-05 TaxID=222819 RepID=UPI001E5C3255|nr:GAF domain-containing protein [[Phormidium] sp. ETS-05]